jgi:ribonucleoside-diphosphate reductase alpha chain
MYTYEESLRDSIEYFNNDELAGKVFVDKYALRNKENDLFHENTPKDMHRRISVNIARIQKRKYTSPLSEEQIFNLIDRFKYIVPQGSPMYGIGNPNYVSIGNCFVLDPPEDTYNSILATDEQLVQISKRRGGVGIDLSKLRPVGASTNNSSRTSTGVPSFMERYSNSIREVGQSGRRGALMLSLSVHHPDVEKFATIKKDKTKVTGANISVRLTDEFLQAVRNDKEYTQYWPLTGKAQIKRNVSARDVWHTLISSAHDMAEPGLLFWDNIIKESPADCYENFKSVSTNPCAELPLSSMDACRLLCLNLLSYVINPYTEEAKFDLKLFFEHSKIAARMMDDIVDLEEECINRILKKIDSDPDPEEIKSRERSIWTRILESCVSGRRCGLGITALGDTLAALGMEYGSDESIEKAEEIYKALKLGSYTASVEMAEELGTFEGWDYEKEKSCPFLKRFKKDVLEYEGEILLKGKELYERMKTSGRRNIALLTIAPTGSVSTMTRTTSGVEPAYLLEYTRRKKGNPGDNNFRVDFIDASGDSWMEFKVYHPQVEKWMKVTGETDVTKSPWYGCCAPDLDWTKRVKLQAALQKHCDHSISSTVNLPNEATVEQVKEIYETAWLSGCKGITVYRDGSRTGVLISDTAKDNSVIKRPDDLPCEVHHISVKGDPYFVLIGLVNGKPYEVFAGRNGCIDPGIKTGVIHKVKRPKCYRVTFDDESQLQPITAACSDNEEALTRMISMSLRHGAAINYVVDQLQKTQGSMTSLAKAIARALKKHVPEGSKSSQKCTACGANMIFQEGCNKCVGCGASKCS